MQNLNARIASIIAELQVPISMKRCYEPQAQRLFADHPGSVFLKKGFFFFFRRHVWAQPLLLAICFLYVFVSEARPRSGGAMGDRSCSWPLIPLQRLGLVRISASRSA